MVRLRALALWRTIAAGRCSRQADRGWRPGLGALVALGIGIAHGSLLATIALSNYRSFNNGWDLAIYDQVHWNITDRGLPQSTLYSNDTINHFGVHFSPVYYFTALVYWLRRSADTLLVLENVALGMGALPLYCLAERVTGRPLVGLLSLQCIS